MLGLAQPDHCSFQDNQGHWCLDEYNNSGLDTHCMFLECRDHKIYWRNTSLHLDNAVHGVWEMLGNYRKHKSRHTKCRSRNNLMGSSSLLEFRQLKKYTRCRNMYPNMVAMKNRRYMSFRHMCFQQKPVFHNFHLWLDFEHLTESSQ
jgi:hypothetical protein